MPPEAPRVVAAPLLQDGPASQSLALYSLAQPSAALRRDVQQRLRWTSASATVELLCSRISYLSIDSSREPTPQRSGFDKYNLMRGG